MKTQLPFPISLGRLLAPAILALPLLGLSLAQAREYEPFVMYVFPAGAQRGTSTEDIMARGRGLEGTSEIRVSGEGVTAQVLGVEKPSTRLRQRSANRQDQAENPNVVKFSVTIAPDAPVGERDLWFITPKGPTNRLHFVVGQLPEVNEADETETKGEPQALPTIPILVNGQYNQQDHDIFRFPAKAGQTLVCEAQGQKLVPYIADAVPGWFQPCLTLYDSDGKELAFVDDFRFHPDPLLIYHVEKDGEYLIDVRDALFRGREDLVYRLSIGVLPYLTHIFPLGGQRGTETPVELHGVNLDTAATTLSLPGDAAGFSNQTRHVRTTGNGLMSNALPFAVGDTPEFTETEPNDSPDQANKIELPRTINGRIQQKGDIDHFAFSAKKGERFVMDVRARRLESPIDSIITLFNADGRLLAENDDTTDLSEGLITHHADSYLAYTFPADGDYVVRLADIETQGGEQYAYRLTIAPPRPNFDLRLFPANLSLARGAAAMVKVRAYRRDGFNGEIDVAFEGLPTGFVAAPATIPAGQTEIRTTITAPPDAPLGIISPTLKGTAIVPKSGNPVAEKKAAEEALAKVKSELQAAVAEHEAAEKVAGEVLAAVAPAQAAAAQAATAHTNAQSVAASKRQQANDAKKKVDDLVAAQQVPAEANVAAAAKAVTDATAARTALDQPLAEAKAATAKAEEASQAAEKAAQEAEAAAKAISEDAAKSEEEKQQAADEAVAKRKAADEAKAALTQTQANEQQAQSQSDAAAAKLAEAQAQKKSAEEALANVKTQVAAATTAQQAAEKAAQEAESAAATAKTETDKAADAAKAAQAAADEKRKLADAAKAKRDKLTADEAAANAKLAEVDQKLAAATVHRQAVPAEELMQAFYYWHDVPTEELLLSVIEPNAFTLSTSIPSAQVHDVRQESELSVVVKVARDGLKATIARAEAAKKTAEEAVAKVKADLEKAKAGYAAAEQAAKAAEAAVPKAKAAAAQAATAETNAQKAAAAKRQQRNEAKAKLDALVAKQQKPAESNVAAAAKAVTDATAAKAAADKALADATAATASFQQASEAAEKAAQEAEAAAKAVGEDAAKSEEEKKQATDQAGAKRKKADDAKAALTQAQQTQQEAKTQVDAAAGKLTQAQAQKQSADEALANANKQVTAATTAHQAADKAAQQAEAAAATAKAEADKARTAQAAAEKDAPAKRAVANEAKAKSGLLANDEKAANATLAERTKRIESLNSLAKAALSLKADPAPRGVTVKAANIAADQNEATVTLTITKGAPVGFRQNIILSGTLRVGPETVIRVAPAIPINVLAAEPPKK